MSTTTSRARRYGVATLAGFAALSLAACGSSSTPSTSSTAASSSSSAAPAPGGKGGKDRVSGLVNSVSGGTVSVTGKDGPATVNITSSTRVTQMGPGQLTDVTAGECVAVRPVKDSDNGPAVTAANVMVRQAGNGQCGQKNEKGDKHEHGIGGTVASVNGNTIVVTAADNSQTTVTVTPDTHYTKSAAADVKAIATGMCLGARGTKDGNGVLQATFAMVRPAVNGACGGGGGDHEHH
ncbi:hypothetical protein BOO86_12310 [Mycobacterium sp. CBMA 234]|uniref:DUF5666 domain-containing protein n=1 Tax=Mycolicibacterium sp. CBMA 234 TaxID=1918495 RepID=UPI0012DD9B66|nr:DUF5666 domain-containing protein [Mycolicibacterium sp. CBMA 234]MUL65252.1 hypothetical protein [Mycolicibacterium sp. CBMA 234]